MAPKERFLSDKDKARRWSDLTTSAEFQEASAWALLELVHRTNTGAQVYDAQAAMHRIDGARRVLVILEKLGEKELPSKRVELPSLEHADTSVPSHLKPHSLQTST